MMENLFIGRWWKFDKYEIRRGCICPARGTTLAEYDPWAVHRKSKKDTNGQPPYRDLILLKESLELPDNPNRWSRHFSYDQKAKLLEWCCKYGLLGVLLNRWLWVECGTKRYLHGAGQGVEEWPVFEDSAGKALIRHISGWVSGTPQAIATTWGKFFPDVRDSEKNTFPFPRPYSEEFWYLYAEPVDEFCQAATMLSNAIMISVDCGEFEGEGSRYERADAKRILADFRGSIRDIDLEQPDGTLMRTWELSSLLAMLAQMYREDQFAGSRLLRCKACKTPVVTTGYQTKYCTKQCRYKAQKSDIRERQREARKLRKAGSKIREIDDELGEPLKRVRGWVKAVKRSRVGRKPHEGGLKQERLLEEA